MALTNSEIIWVLNSLIEICRDGNQGFKDAGDDVKDKKLRELLHEYSEQRMNYSLELTRLVEKFGGDINVTGSILGSLHRRWMDLRFGIICSDTDSILKECLRGENAAIKKYGEALQRKLPDDVRAVIERQYAGIKKAVDNIEKLIDDYGLSAASF